MLQLDRVPDATQPQTEPVTGIAPVEEQPLLPALTPIVDRQPSAAEPPDSLHGHCKSRSPKHGHAAPGHTHDAMGFDARVPATLHGQGVKQLQLSTLPTPISKLASLLQQRHNKHAQLPMTSSSSACHPLHPGPTNQSPLPEQILPASLMHIQPQHLSKLQLQNLRKAAELLLPSSSTTIATDKIMSPHPNNPLASVATKVQLPLQQNAAYQMQSMQDRAAAPPEALDAMDCCTTQLSTAARAEALHDDMPCSSGSYESVQNHASEMLFGEHDDSGDTVAARLDRKLASMAPAVSTLHVDTLCTGGHQSHVAPLASIVPSGVQVRRKRSMSSMHLEVAVHLPVPGALSSCRPVQTDHAIPACMQQSTTACNDGTAGLVQEWHLIQGEPDVQRKRFRKTTGIEVLYRTMPLICEQLFPSRIPS